MGFGFQAQNTNDVEGGMLAYAQIDYPGFSSPFVMIQTDGYNLASVRGDKIPSAIAIRSLSGLRQRHLGHRQDFVANADGSSRRQLTYGYQPDWQHLS